MVCENCCQRQEGVGGLAVAGRQAGVADHDPGEAVGIGGDDAQADQAAPVLAEEGDVAQVEVLDERASHPLDVAGVRVVGHLGRLVAATEADEVGGDDAVTGGDEHAGSSCGRGTTTTARRASAGPAPRPGGPSST